MSIHENLTILVNSCDSYEDLWTPFFTLLKKYGNLSNVPILLNTESKSFSMDGLNIASVHFPKNEHYGKRIRNVLAHVKTEYVLVLLDDFFLRKPVDVDYVAQIISWMASDSDIACFNMEAITRYVDWEMDKYPGFCRVAPGTDYALNMQAAVWRTQKLRNLWKPKVSPWEWETYCSFLLADHSDYKIYCRTSMEDPVFDYGHYRTGDIWAIVRGKWVKEDVVPLFEKEQIEVDYTKRGFYDSGKDFTGIPVNGRFGWYNLIYRCMGVKWVFCFVLYRIQNKLSAMCGKNVDSDFFLYTKESIQKSFNRQYGDDLCQK